MKRTLKSVLKRTVQIIKDGVIDSEAQVKQVIIQPILEELGYNYKDPEEVIPEFSVDKRLADKRKVGLCNQAPRGITNF